MNLKLTTLFFVCIIGCIALTGCEMAEQMIITDPVPTPEADAVPVQLVWFIDYPEGGKDAYIAWVASIAPALQAPEEVVRIKSYDNLDPDTGADRLVSFEFKSFIDAATYLNRPEIAAVLEDLPNRAAGTTVHTFIQRSDYAKDEAGDWAVRYISLVDYPLGGKDAYLEWVASIAPVLTAIPEVKAITSYDNYYGESPHRLVELEFATVEDYRRYEALEAVQGILSELDTRTASWSALVFELRSDYINE